MRWILVIKSSDVTRPRIRGAGTGGTKGAWPLHFFREGYMVPPIFGWGISCFKNQGAKICGLIHRPAHGIHFGPSTFWELPVPLPRIKWRNFKSPFGLYLYSSNFCPERLPPTSTIKEAKKKDVMRLLSEVGATGDVAAFYEQQLKLTIQRVQVDSSDEDSDIEEVCSF